MARRKITFGDWMRGASQSIKNGTVMNPITTQRIINAAHDERVAREDKYPRPEKDWGWYSKYRSSDGTIHVMLDRNGEPTTKYPHVHVIHDEPGGQVRIVLSLRKGEHPETRVLPGTSSGNEVNAAIDQMLRKL